MNTSEYADTTVQLRDAPKVHKRTFLDQPREQAEVRYHGDVPEVAAALAKTGNQRKYAIEKTVEDRGRPWKTVEERGRPWRTMEDY